MKIDCLCCVPTLSCDTNSIPRPSIIGLASSPTPPCRNKPKSLKSTQSQRKDHKNTLEDTAERALAQSSGILRIPTSTFLLSNPLPNLRCIFIHKITGKCLVVLVWIKISFFVFCFFYLCVCLHEYTVSSE